MKRLNAIGIMVFLTLCFCSSVMAETIAKSSKGTEQSVDAASWPLQRGDIAGTAATKTELPAKPELLWEYEIEGLGFEATPIIAEDTVFAADAEGRVVAISLADGKEKWKLEYPESAFVQNSSPAYQNGAIYIGDVDGIVRKLNAKNGKEIWKFDTEAEIDAGPNFFKNLVLVTSQSGSLFALDTETGNLEWEYETGDQLQCSPTLAGDRTFLGGCDAKLHTVNVADGTAVGEKVELGGPTGSTPSFADQVVFLPTYAGEIFAIQQPENKVIWLFSDPKLSSEFKNSVAIGKGLVVAASRNKKLFALEAKTGEVKWETTLRKRSDSSPIIVGDQVAVAAGDGRIMLFDLKTGEQQWLFEVKGSFLASPVAAAGKLVVATDRGTIHCFGAK